MNSVRKSTASDVAIDNTQHKDDVRYNVLIKNVASDVLLDDYRPDLNAMLIAPFKILSKLEET